MYIKLHKIIYIGKIDTKLNDKLDIKILPYSHMLFFPLRKNNSRVEVTVIYKAA